MRLFESERSGKLYQKVLELAGIFSSAGGRALLVGGAVRDALRGRCVKDFDLEVHNLSSERVLELLQGVCEVDAVGMSFGVIKVKHLELDISLPRRENKVGKGHRGFLVEVDPALSIAEAAARRDFTVNAIMYDPLSEELLDPHGGLKDIEKKILRHVSSHFAEDPLRVLRGMQFAARMKFSFAPETVALCAGISQEELAVERIGSEWEKLLLQGEVLSVGLEFLEQCRWIRFYPELEALSAESRRAMGDFLDKCASLRCCERQKGLLFMTAALLSFLTPGSEKNFCFRLWNRGDMINKALNLAEVFRELCRGSEKEQSRPEIRRFSLRLNGLELLCLLLEAAGQTAYAQKIQAVGIEENIFSAGPLPLITGKHAIDLGVAPGPTLGKLVKSCFEAQLDGVFADLEKGREYLETLVREKIF